MQKLSSYLLVIFMIMFWAFRAVLTLMSQMGKDILGVVPMNTTIEIILIKLPNTKVFLLPIFLLIAVEIIKKIIEVNANTVERETIFASEIFFICEKYSTFIT